MGFCSRCGDIVAGPRCRCGGTPVAPVVKWSQGDAQNQDRWSRTYVTRDKSPTRPTRTEEATNETSSSSDYVRRFPQPASSARTSQITLNTRVSAHIASATSTRPPSPLKHSTSFHDIHATSPSAHAAAGILPNPSNGSELAKVYGSVLQPKESLDSYHCALCSTPFPPDATIYPDPSSLSSAGTRIDSRPSTRFFCRACFTTNGGSKGDCPVCHRPVLILKSEGGFVENGGRVWHKKCFACEGCGKNIGDNPMVDLLGKPSCADCFESCLKRSNRDTPKKSGATVDDDLRSNLGGTRRSERPREGSPALEELEQRLGIIRSRENTPAVEDRFVRSGTKSPTGTPSNRHGLRHVGSVESSPVVERLAARARTDSFTAIGASPIMQVQSTGGEGSARALNRFKSPEPDTSDTDFESPSVRRGYRMRSPDPAESVGDGSPAPRRPYSRYRSPEPDVFGSSPISRGASPRYGSPRTSQPTEEAIEEMKRRFLRQISPTPSGSPSAAPSNTTTPRRRRSKSRSRSRPRSSNTGDRRLEHQVTDSTPPLRVAKSPRASDAPSLRSSPSVPELRSFVRAHKTGEMDYTLRRDRTGDAEVESLLGDMPPPAPPPVLVDVSTDSPPRHDISRPVSTGPISNIPIIPTTLPTAHSTGATPLVLRNSFSNSSLDRGYEASVSSTPDLAGDFSDTTTQSSAPPTPPSLSPPNRRESTRLFSSEKVVTHHTGKSEGSRRSKLDTTPTPKSKTLPQGLAVSPTPLAADARCAKCNLALFTTKHGGKFVTVPEEPSISGLPPKTYHTACFKCKVCDRPFEERDGGRTIFVRSEFGACHPECAPPEKVKVRQMPSMIPKPTFTSSTTTPLSTSRTVNTTQYSAPSSSSRYERPPPSAPATTTTFTFPRFGGSTSCPGCNISVSPMERGVVPGPQGTRWHANCLACGGNEVKGRRKEEGKPGCGKKLDSAAKTDSDGRVWCRECLLLLPPPMRNTPSPTRPIAPSDTGGRSVAPLYTGTSTVVRQMTGTTTIARQFTGLRGGNGDAGLLRQMTGGGLSPTRQRSTSPTKLYDGPRPGSGRTFPRPRSVIGTRSGEGRGMFLVRQLTGGKETPSGDDYGL